MRERWQQSYQNAHTNWSRLKGKSTEAAGRDQNSYSEGEQAPLKQKEEVNQTVCQHTITSLWRILCQNLNIVSFFN